MKLGVTDSRAERAAFLVADSKNTKISGRGKVAATYASIGATCPSACALRDHGCYAQMSLVALFERKLDQRASGFEAARQEASAIRNAFCGGPIDGRPIRMHVSGDAKNAKAARILAEAIADWTTRGGGPAWTYTHAWRSIPREAWGPISVLASIEHVTDAVHARERGYVPALVVPELPPDGKAFELFGVRWIPCPAQTRNDVACTDCRLCFDDASLFERRAGIAFAAHGWGARGVKRQLTVINDGRS